MASAVVEAYLGITGLTLVVDLFPLGSDTAGATAIAMTEATNRKGLYTGTTAAALTGEHQAFMKTGTTVIGLGYVQMTDDTSIHRIVDAADVAEKSGTSNNVGALNGDAQSLLDLKDFAADGYDPATNKVQGVVLVDAAATLTSLPAITVGWLTADGIATDAITDAKVASDVTIASVTGAVGSVTTPVTAGTVSDKTGYALSGAGITAVQSGLATQADINALNQSASRRILLVTVPQYERPESGTNSYTVEMRLFDGDGAAVNADSDPTLTATGIVSGSLSANLSASSNPATGVYRWTYSELAAAALEQIRIDGSAVVAAATFTLSVYTQSADFIAATWTTVDAANLTSIYNKLPSRAYLTGATASTGSLVATDVVVASSVTGNVAGSVGSVTAAVVLPTIPTAWITADGIATDAIGSAEVSATAVTKIQAGLATPTNITSASGVVLTSAYDPAKTAATQTSVDDLPTNAELATALGTADDATLAAIATAQITLTRLETGLELDGSVYRWTTNALEQAPAGGGGSGLTGANLVTITVKEGATPIEGAKVRVTWAAQTEIKLTNVSGIVTFQLDNATWSIAVTKNGYNSFSTTLVVDGPETPSDYLLTKIVPTPSAAGYITIFGVYEAGGVVQTGQTVAIYQNRAFGTGLIQDRSERTTTTNGSGYWEFTGIIAGAGYMIGAGPELREMIQLDVPEAATDPYEVASFLGT